MGLPDRTIFSFGDAIIVHGVDPLQRGFAAQSVGGQKDKLHT